jgi:hypothetical protein
MPRKRCIDGECHAQRGMLESCMLRESTLCQSMLVEGGGRSVEGRHVGHFMLGRLGGCMMDMLGWRHAARRHAWH